LCAGQHTSWSNARREGTRVAQAAEGACCEPGQFQRGAVTCVTVCGQQRPSVLRGGLWCGLVPGRVVLTVCLWGLFTDRDDVTWTPEIEARFPEDHDPDKAFCKPHSGKRQPYSDLYMYLLMQTISRWPHVKAILPSGAELNKGPAYAETQCKKLVKASYEAAFNPQHGISTMTLLDPKLYKDKEWVHAQVSPFHTILICSDQLSKVARSLSLALSLSLSRSLSLSLSIARSLAQALSLARSLAISLSLALSALSLSR